MVNKNKNSAMSYLFPIANGIKHHNIKKKKVQVSSSNHIFRYVNRPESQLKICFKYVIILNSKGY